MNDEERHYNYVLRLLSLRAQADSIVKEIIGVDGKDCAHYYFNTSTGSYIGVSFDFRTTDKDKFTVDNV